MQRKIMYRKTLLNLTLSILFIATASIAPGFANEQETFVSHEKAKQLEDRIKVLEEYNNDLQNQLKQNGNNIEKVAVEQIKQNALDLVTKSVTAIILHNINVPQLQKQIIYTVEQQIKPHINQTLINSFDSQIITNQIVTTVSDKVQQHVKNEFQTRAIDKLTNDLREPVYQKTIQDIVDNFDTERAISTIMQKISKDIIYQLKAQFSKDAVQQLTTELKASVHKQAQKEIVHSTNVAELKDELYVKFTNEYVPRLRDELDIKAHAKNLLSAQKVYGQVLAARYVDENNEHTQRALSLLLDGCGSWDKMTLEKLHTTPCEIAIATAKELLKRQSQEKKS